MIVLSVLALILVALSGTLADIVVILVHGPAQRWLCVAIFGYHLVALWWFASRVRKAHRTEKDLARRLEQCRSEVVMRERLQKEIYRVMPIGVAIMDGEKRVLYANLRAKAMLPRVEGLDSGRLTCRDWFCTEATCKECALLGALRSRSSNEPIYLVRDANGDAQRLEMVTMQMMSDSSEADRTLVFIRDVTADTIVAGAMRDEMIVYGKALARLIDVRDGYTGNHSRNVAAWSVEIARRLGLTADHMGRLRIAALLHDLGKIGVPEAILLKEGKLSGEERRVMQRHPDIGADAIHELRAFVDIVPWIRHHHERNDGRGYPRGLRGEEIPLESKIIAGADVYDALTSDRPYRKAISYRDALEVLAAMRGAALDAAVVDALTAAVRERQ